MVEHPGERAYLRYTEDILKNHPGGLRGPLGHTKLSQTVARLCSSAGIPGFKTNHSLRATTTSRLYHAGVDEQLVMERTGHRSVEGVRSCKRTSDAQREALSDILNRPAMVGAITNTTPVAPAPTLPTIIKLIFICPAQSPAWRSQSPVSNVQQLSNQFSHWPCCWSCLFSPNTDPEEKENTAG